ncbi:hypothetical protein J2S05_003832 [Alkalicoccobacillus murimartini]|uniref:Uncharacterized protein n=1 Tax=Alkalicoccobacillus murimartini TaxID=171685 RepID=A0ABT9YN41_9BACI|nr:hypothetical protein [Alkalicoccobacillus murimartini]
MLSNKEVFPLKGGRRVKYSFSPIASTMPRIPPFQKGEGPFEKVPTL